MPRLFVYDTGRPKTTRFTIAFARGVIKQGHKAPNRAWEVKHIPIQQYLAEGLPKNIVPGKDAVATLGILRGTGLRL